MKILINDKRKLFSIQQKFSAEFPNLKMEFHSKPSKKGGAASIKLIHKEGRTIADCRNLHNSGLLVILPGMTVNELQKNLSDSFGLTVNFLQKKVNVWVPVKTGSRLSLEDENKS